MADATVREATLPGTGVPQGLREFADDWAADQEVFKGVHWGNATNWDNAARAAGIPVYKTPKVGDIAVRDSGTWGHVAYVAKVNADGSFMVEEYNHLRPDTYSYRKAHRGTDADVQPGDLFTIYRMNRQGGPPVVLGELAILSSRSGSAIAKILESRYPIYVGDRLERK